MSLISDALKTAQRERSGRPSSSGTPQPLLEGFFPYVSSTPTRGRSRLIPILALSSAVLVLAIVGWIFWPRTGNVSPLPSRPPIAATPDTATKSVPADAVVGTETPPINVANEQTAAAPPENPVERPVVTGGAPRVPVRDASVASAQTNTADTVSRAPEARSQPAVTRVDYEAQATALFNAGDLGGAREKFELATRFAPTARAWTNYGVTLQRLGDERGAAAAYQAAVGIDANYLEAWLFQGRLAAEAGDISRAIPLLQRARVINPRNAEVNVELARLQNDAKNWTETRRFAEDAVRADPANARGHWYLALAADGLKDTDTAIRGFNSYLANVDAADRDQAPFVGYARKRLVELRGKP